MRRQQVDEREARDGAEREQENRPRGRLCAQRRGDAVGGGDHDRVRVGRRVLLHRRADTFAEGAHRTTGRHASLDAHRPELDKPGHPP